MKCPKCKSQDVHVSGAKSDDKVWYVDCPKCKYKYKYDLQTGKPIKEAQVDTPGQVMKKAQLAKVRADARQLGQKQKTLAQSKRNTRDTMTKRRLSKQQADLGVKKADLGIRSAEMSQQIKKPTNEYKLSHQYNSIKVGKFYAVFGSDYEPHSFIELDNMNELPKVMKDRQGSEDFVGVFKCVKV